MGAVKGTQEIHEKESIRTQPKRHAQATLQCKNDDSNADHVVRRRDEEIGPWRRSLFFFSFDRSPRSEMADSAYRSYVPVGDGPSRRCSSPRVRTPPPPPMNREVGVDGFVGDIVVKDRCVFWVCPGNVDPVFLEF